MSLGLWPIALLAFANLMLAASPAHSKDFAEGAKFITDACPGEVKTHWPSAAPGESEAICGCVQDYMAASSKDYQAKLPTQQQWSELGKRAAMQCMQPYARHLATQQCIANTAARQRLTGPGRFSDSQFDRYCVCNTQVVMDEGAKGVNLDDPSVQSAILRKVQAICVAPLLAEKPTR